MRIRVFGAGMTGGIYSSPCVSKLNGLSNASVVVSGSHNRPVWRKIRLKLPSDCRVAEVNTAPAARRHRLLARWDALLMGLALKI